MVKLICNYFTSYHAFSRHFSQSFRKMKKEKKERIARHIEIYTKHSSKSNNY